MFSSTSPLLSSPSPSGLRTPKPPSCSHPTPIPARPFSSRSEFRVSIFKVRLQPSPNHSPLATALNKSPHQYHSAGLTFPLLSYSYALFCIAQNAISNLFNAFRTLCKKHPGRGSHPSRQGLRRSAQATNLSLRAFQTPYLVISLRDCFIPAPPQRRLDGPNLLSMLKCSCTQGATRFRRKLSRPEGMPGPTCP